MRQPNKDVETALLSLERDFEEFKEIAKVFLSGNMYMMDLYATAVLNRAFALIDGFCILIRNENFICAVHLVRLHLDNFIRFNAAWLVSDPHEFVSKVLDGEQINKLKDKEGNRMTDQHLISCLESNYPWIKKVYAETSGFIHLSNKHMFMSAGKSEESKKLQYAISRKDTYIKDVSRLEAIYGMMQINESLASLMAGWAYTKNNPPKNA